MRLERLDDIEESFLRSTILCYVTINLSKNEKGLGRDTGLQAGYV